ncbi:MAG: AI-2E family transporter, partial [Alsobacter sp.]
MALIPDPTTTRPPLPRFPRYGSAPAPGLRDPAVAPVNAGVAILAVAVIGALWAGQDIFVPIALAVLLSFVLAPAVRRLQAWRMPRAAAVPVVVLLAFAVILLIGTAVAMQVRELAVNLPLYQSTIREKAMTTRDALAGKGALGRAAAMMEDLGRELKKPTASPAVQDLPIQDRTVKGLSEQGLPGQGLPGQGLAAPAAGPAPPPVTAAPTPLPVEVHQPDPGPVQALSDMLAPVLRPLATAGLIVIFVVFILLQREDLRNRMIRLAGAHDIQRTTAAIDDAAHRLSRLYLAQL